MKSTKWTPEGKKQYMREYYQMGKRTLLEIHPEVVETEAQIEKRINEEHLKTIFGVEYEDVMV